MRLDVIATMRLDISMSWGLDYCFFGQSFIYSCTPYSLARILHLHAGFHSLDIETGNVLNMFVPFPAPKGGITPTAIVQLPSDDAGEYLLSFDRKCDCESYLQ